MLESQKINVPCVLVTRPRPHGAVLCEKIRALGLGAIYFPTMEFVPLNCKQQIMQLEQYDWLIFISPQAVYQTAQYTFPESIHIAAVGAGTAHALQERMLPVHACPQEEWSSEGLLALPEFQQWVGKKIAIIQGQGGRELLSEALEARGAKVMRVCAYQRILPKYESRLEWLHKQTVNMIVCTSNQGLENLIILCKNLESVVKMIPVLVISERMHIHAKALGFQRVLIARNASHDAILEMIKKETICPIKQCQKKRS